MVLILIALGCGLVASIAISQVLERGSGSGNAALETVQIYVATSDIDVNEQLTADNVRVEDWPKSKVPEGSILDFDQVNERFARVRFYEGEPILTAKLANEIEGAAIKIPEGYRVCSLKVQMDTAVSGLVNPGDRVDIIGYFRKGQDVPRTGTREILRNVRVFAVNSETEQVTDQEGQVIVAKTVSVLVEHKQVARLMLATELGVLRLALKNPMEELDSTEGNTASVESLFSSRSENADENEDEDSGPLGGSSSQLASAAGGFAKFMANLRTNQAPAATAAALPVATGPAWQMTIITPDGGTNFTWNDVNQPPVEGAMTSGMSGVTAPITPPTSPAPAAGSADVVDGTPDLPAEEEEEEEEEEEDIPMDDD
jgi:pilus assembly protein CpaB